MLVVLMWMCYCDFGNTYVTVVLQYLWYLYDYNVVNLVLLYDCFIVMLVVFVDWSVCW